MAQFGNANRSISGILDTFLFTSGRFETSLERPRRTGKFRHNCGRIFLHAVIDRGAMALLEAKFKVIERL